MHLYMRVSISTAPFFVAVRAFSHETDNSVGAGRFSPAFYKIRSDITSILKMG